MREGGKKKVMVRMCDMTQGGTQKAEGQNVPRRDKQSTITTYLLLDMSLNLLP
ncbi:hypothetical protein QG37_05789 [Candidozyma auris]|nr:hypothetical protein QG37_05789 [[Candida] auris]